MKYKTARLETICSIRTGAPISRAKKVEEGSESLDVRVLIPKAMSNGHINSEYLAHETVGEVKDELYTHADDVVLKLSTPYDSVYINKENEGILVTSFGMILRKHNEAQINMRFLSMFLNSSLMARVLASKSSGTAIQVLKRADVAGLEIPLLLLEQQDLLASLDASVNERRAIYERLIALDIELVNNQLMETIWGE